jgi:hypothetical protein
VHHQTIYWVFRAVTYDLDSFRKHEINRPDLPHGRIDSGKNYVAWLRIWGSLLEDCRARLEYLREALKIRRSRAPTTLPVLSLRPDAATHADTR